MWPFVVKWPFDGYAAHLGWPAGALTCRLSQPTIGQGRALVGPTEDPVELRSGDYLAYPGDEPHTFRALAPHTFAVLVSDHG